MCHSRCLLQSEPASHWCVWTVSLRASTFRLFAHSIPTISLFLLTVPTFTTPSSLPPLPPSAVLWLQLTWKNEPPQRNCLHVRTFACQRTKGAVKNRLSLQMSSSSSQSSCRVKEEVSCSLRHFSQSSVQHRPQWVWNCRNYILTLGFCSSIKGWTFATFYEFNLEVLHSFKTVLLSNIFCPATTFL